MHSDSILIVDGDVDKRESLEILLTLLLNKDYDLIAANNGKEALNLLSKHNGWGPDNESLSLIISDMILPDIRGIDFLQISRSLGIETPILFVTRLAVCEDYLEVMNAGAYDYLAEPIDPNELILKVNAMIHTPKSLC